MLKELLSATAIVLTFVIFVPYIRSIHRGHTRPRRSEEHAPAGQIESQNSLPAAAETHIW